MRKLLTVLFIVAVSAIEAYATHNRAGEICYEHINGLTFEFTLITYTNPDSPADRDSLTIVFDSRDPIGTAITIPRSTETILTAGEIKKNTYVTSYTFPGPDCYVVYMEDPNRVEGICNIDGSVNVPFYLEDTICIVNPTLVGYNSSPILAADPIENATVGEVWTHIPSAYDPDGDSLSFSLIVPKQAPGLDVPGYEYPQDYDGCGASFTIDRATGQVTWTVPCQPCIYNIAILVREFRDGRFLGSKIRDMQIFVDDGNNNPPDLADVMDTCIIAGDRLQFLVSATDPDGDELTLTADGGPLLLDNSPATFPTSTGTGSVNELFDWQTICGHVRKSVYQVVFRATDDHGFGGVNPPLSDVKGILITVVAPPPQNVTAIAAGNRIEIQWDSLYECFGSKNFQGFSIWRKTGCDSIEFGSCQRGLGGTGYTKIGEVDSAHRFTDNSVVRGPVYAYRVVAEFAESPEGSPFTFNHVGSRPSDPACAELKRDLPILTNASVEFTSQTAGEVFVAWVPPDADDLDTIENPGPYRYELYESEGLLPTSAALIATFNSISFAAYNDTSFTSTGLNTEDNPYNYTIRLFAQAGTADELFIGETTSASTIFLNAGSLDNALNLTWNVVVPWDNVSYDVFREIPVGSGTFVQIATVAEPMYLDDSLANGTEYCYYVRGIGSYGSESLPDSLINFSQENCATPEDTAPPCAPFLTVENICTEAENIPFSPEDLSNDLHWNNPNLTCADDVVSYNIYFTEQQGTPLQLLETITSAEDTAWSHEYLLSLAGCYAVTAVDSFNNESPLSNIVCKDNCPLYVLPNVFTPNNDGSNDFFTPFLPYRFISSIDMQIYNRWGGLVYSTNDPMISWDGNYNGKPLSEGVYYYVCKLVEQRVEGAVTNPVSLEGYIHLIRGNGGRNP